jgi:hypothetical protein
MRAFGIVGAGIGLWFVGMSSASAQTSMLCQFTVGPRAGHTIDFTGVQGAQPGIVGSQCSDGLSSTGIVVSSGNGTASPALSPPQTVPPMQGGMSTTCQFTSGPRAGQTVSFAGIPGVTPSPVGGPCSDGMSSMGVAVADSTPGAQRAQISMTCRFTTGPRAGQTVNFQNVAGARPGVVGGPCSDGVSSRGVVVP